MSRVVGGNRAQRHVVAGIERLFGPWGVSTPVTAQQLERWAGDGLGPALRDNDDVNDDVIAHYASIAKVRKPGPQAKELILLTIALKGGPVLDEYVHRGVLAYLDRIEDKREDYRRSLNSGIPDLVATGVLPKTWTGNGPRPEGEATYDEEEDVDAFLIEEQNARRKQGNNSRPEEMTLSMRRRLGAAGLDEPNTPGDVVDRYLLDSFRAQREGGAFAYPELAAEAVRALVNFPVYPEAFSGDHASAAEVDDVIRNRWTPEIIPVCRLYLRGLERRVSRFGGQPVVVEPFTFLREVISEMILAHDRDESKL